MRLTRFSPTPPARCRAGPLLLGRAPAAGCRPNWRRHHPLLHRRSPCAHRNLASAPVPPRLPTAPPSPNARRLRERAGFGNGGRVSLPAAAAGRERPLSCSLGRPRRGRGPLVGGPGAGTVLTPLAVARAVVLV